MTRYSHTRTRVKSNGTSVNDNIFSSRSKFRNKSYSQNNKRRLSDPTYSNSNGYGFGRSSQWTDSGWIASDTRGEGNSSSHGTNSSVNDFKSLSNNDVYTITSSFGISYFGIMIAIFFALAFCFLIMNNNKSIFNTTLTLADCVADYGSDFKEIMLELEDTKLETLMIEEDTSSSDNFFSQNIDGYSDTNWFRNIIKGGKTSVTTDSLSALFGNVGRGIFAIIKFIFKFIWCFFKFLLKVLYVIFL